jgi:hypothetical protein
MMPLLNTDSESVNSIVSMAVNDQLGTIGWGTGIARVEAHIIGDCVAIIAPLESHSELRVTALVDFLKAMGVDPPFGPLATGVRIGQNRGINAIGGSLKIGTFQLLQSEKRTFYVRPNRSEFGSRRRAAPRATSQSQLGLDNDFIVGHG